MQAVYMGSKSVGRVLERRNPSKPIKYTNVNYKLRELQNRNHCRLEYILKKYLHILALVL